jgi:hypothetical protein
VFSGEPFHGIRTVTRGAWAVAGDRCADLNRYAARKQQPLAGKGGVDVVVDELPQRRFPTVVGLVVVSLVSGVEADEVVRAVAAGVGLL